MSTARKQLHVNLFEMNCVGHISHGLWVHPRNTRHRFNELSFWTELAQVLEDGCFDAVFLADVIGTYDGFRGGPQTALREAVQIPDNDPLSIISAMAVATPPWRWPPSTWGSQRRSAPPTSPPSPSRGGCPRWTT